MQLAKNVIDIGLSTNNLEPMLRFWQQDAAVRFDHAPQDRNAVRLDPFWNWRKRLSFTAGL